ncbi:hypothetical protein GCM10023115_02090 [Pontixanthobacter gangjinensis]|nr:mechanosensitive ion channel domain-containing protein [Pontixanthobacter gangjinensis]
MRKIWQAVAMCLLMLTGPAYAILPAAPETEAGEPAPAQLIEPEIVPGEDERIAKRLRGIYGVLDHLSAVTVEVEQGVVTLNGALASQADIDEAEGLADQIDGVVTVQNKIERDVSIGENLGALGSLSERFTDFVKFLPLLGAAFLVALLISLLGYAIAGLRGFWRRISPNVFLAELIASAIRFVFVIGGAVIALDMIGAGALLGAVLGGAGVIGIALGFAMRETIENYVASLMLSLRQPFQANDHVLIDDLEGRIIRLTSRATVMMTMDGNHLRVPNSTVFKAVITNFTRNPQRRFDFELGVDAEDDPTAARCLGVSVLKELPFVLDNPEPSARIEQVGDSNIVIRYLGWIDQQQADIYKARSRAIHAVKDALENNGFALPEPIYRLRFDSAAPLNFEGAATMTTGEKPKVERPDKPVRPPLPDEDVSPVTEISEMVRAERAADLGDDDLLDSERPIE